MNNKPMTTKDSWEEVKNSWMKFNELGDYVIGTLIAVREVKSQLPGSEGQMTKVYEIKADEGVFHDLDDKKKVIEEAVAIKEGEIWNLGGGSKEKPSILDGQFRNIKLGQKVKVEYTDDKPAKQKGFNPMKVKKVYTNGKMDEQWIAEQEAANNAAALEAEFKEAV